MIVRRSDTGRIVHMTPTSATWAQRQAASAALQAARPRLPGLPDDVYVQFFEDVTDSGLSGWYDRKDWPRTVWVWVGQQPKAIRHTVGHELLHLWGAHRGFELTEAECDAFADGSPEPVFRAILANQTIRIVAS